MLKSLLSQAIRGMLQEAISMELYASHLYRHVSNHMQRIGYFGAAKHFSDESADEIAHYQKHADYINDRGAVAEVPSLPAMSSKVASLRAAIELAYTTEQELGANYEKWYRQCSSDVTTQQHLLQFLEIQRKSIGEYGDLLARLDQAGDNPAALLIIDKELGS